MKTSSSSSSSSSLLCTCGSSCPPQIDILIGNGQRQHLDVVMDAAGWVEKDGVDDSNALLVVVLQLVDGSLVRPPVLSITARIYQSMESMHYCNA